MGRKGPPLCECREGHRFASALRGGDRGTDARAHACRWQLRGQPSSNQIFLNDQPLVYSATQGLPPMAAKSVFGLQLPPASVSFCVYDDAAASLAPVSSKGGAD